MPKPRKPTHLKIVSGTRRLDRENPLEPKLPPGTPPMPAILTPRAAGVWPRFVAELERMGTLTTADQAALVELCELWAELTELRLFLSENGRTYDSGGLLKTRPEVPIMAEARRVYLALLQQFGLTAASRSKVNVVQNTEMKDPAEQFFA